MQDVWKFAQDRMKHAQGIQQKQANKHQREPDFDVGDLVWLSLKGYKTGRPNKKLDHQWTGPFKILERRGHSFRLDLPPQMKIHDVISPDKLRKSANDPLSGQVVEPPDAFEINGEQEWEVEKVLASRLYRKKLQYRVTWLGWDEDLTWYPAQNFKGSPHLIRDFHNANKSKPGPPRNLDNWLQAWEKGQDLPDIPDDNLPI